MRQEAEEDDAREAEAFAQRKKAKDVAHAAAMTAAPEVAYVDEPEDSSSPLDGKEHLDYDPENTGLYLPPPARASAEPWRGPEQPPTAFHAYGPPPRPHARAPSRDVEQLLKRMRCPIAMQAMRDKENLERLQRDGPPGWRNGLTPAQIQAGEIERQGRGYWQDPLGFVHQVVVPGKRTIDMIAAAKAAFATRKGAKDWPSWVAAQGVPRV